MKIAKTSEEIQSEDEFLYRRAPMLAHARSESARLLGNPTAKLNRGQRKALHFSRSFKLIPTEPITPRAPAVRLALKLRTLTMVQLGNRLAQFARRASTAKHIIARLPRYSTYRNAVQASQDGDLAAFKQVDAEIDARLLACKGKLAEAKA